MSERFDKFEGKNVRKLTILDKLRLFSALYLEDMSNLKPDYLLQGCDIGHGVEPEWKLPPLNLQAHDLLYKLNNQKPSDQFSTHNFEGRLTEEGRRIYGIIKNHIAQKPPRQRTDSECNVVINFCSKILG